MVENEKKRYGWWAYFVYGFYSYYRRRDNTPMIFTVIVIGLVVTLYILSLINIYGLVTATYAGVNLLLYLCVYFGSLIVVYFSIAFNDTAIENYCKYFDREYNRKKISSGSFAFVITLIGLILFITTIIFLRGVLVNDA